MPKGRTGSRKMPDKAAALWGFPPRVPRGRRRQENQGQPEPTKVSAAVVFWVQRLPSGYPEGYPAPDRCSRDTRQPKSTGIPTASLRRGRSNPPASNYRLGRDGSNPTTGERSRAAVEEGRGGLRSEFIPTLVTADQGGERPADAFRLSTIAHSITRSSPPKG